MALDDHSEDHMRPALDDHCEDHMRPATCSVDVGRTDVSISFGLPLIGRDVLDAGRHILT